jgi:hypothetical protein
MFNSERGNFSKEMTRFRYCKPRTGGVLTPGRINKIHEGRPSGQPLFQVEYGTAGKVTKL